MYMQLQSHKFDGRILGKVRFFYWGGGGGWAGTSEGRVISKYFTNWGGSNLFDTQPGEGQARKILSTPCRLVDLYLLTNTRSV